MLRTTIENRIEMFKLRSGSTRSTKMTNKKYSLITFVMSTEKKTFNFNSNKKKASRKDQWTPKTPFHSFQRSLTLSHETKTTKRNYAKGQTNSPKLESDDNDIPRIAFILLHQCNHPETNNIHHVRCNRLAGPFRSIHLIRVCLPACCLKKSHPMGMGRWNLCLTENQQNLIDGGHLKFSS